MITNPQIKAFVKISCAQSAVWFLCFDFFGRQYDNKKDFLKLCIDLFDNTLFDKYLLNSFDKTSRKMLVCKISIYININNIYSDFKTQETNLKLEKISKLQSKILVEKRVIKHL